MAEKALTPAIQDAYVQGISTRSVDDLVKAMNMSGISKSRVRRPCEEIDGKAKAFLERPIEGDWPLHRDGCDLPERRCGGRIVSVAVTIAVGVNSDVAAKFSAWRSAPRRPSRSGRSSCASSPDAARAGSSWSSPTPMRSGLRATVTKVLSATWQLCRIHFLRNVLAHAAKAAAGVVSAFVPLQTIRQMSDDPLINLPAAR